MKTAFGSENNKLVTVLAWVDCPVIGLPVPVKNVKMAKDYKLVNCSHEHVVGILSLEDSGGRPFFDTTRNTLI